MAAKARRKSGEGARAGGGGIRGMLLSPEGFSPWPAALVSLILLGAWLAAVCLMSARHEPWGDEVRALTLSLEPAHWWQIPQALQNEGHPALWYLILRFAHDAIGTPAVLKGASVAVAFLAVVLLFWRGPFPLGWKALFAFSFLPLYEYSVIARNYGLTLLFAFAFAAAYPLRARQPYLLALLLALLANTNVHSMPLAAGLLGLWLWDEILSAGVRGSLSRARPLLIPAALVALSLAAAAATCVPEKGYLPPGVSPLTPSSALRDALQAALHPGGTFPVLLPFPGPVRDGIVWVLLAGLLRWVPGLLLLLGYDVALQVLFLAVYAGGLRHQGLLLVAAVSLYWMAADRRRKEGAARGGPLARGGRVLFAVALFGVLPLLFAVHVWLSRGPIALDWERPFSSNKAFAAFLRQDPALGRAILVPEPATLADSLPYYCDNRIFLPWQDSFGHRALNPRSLRTELNLGELLQRARAQSAGHHVPALILWGHPPPVAERPGEIAFPDGRVLRWTGGEAADFLASTRQVAAFSGSVSEENYAVYQVLR